MLPKISCLKYVQLFTAIANIGASVMYSAIKIFNR